MPYDIRKVGSRWCVYKQGTSRRMGCHDSKAGAERQRRAIHASESRRGAASAERSTVTKMTTVTETQTIGGGAFGVTATGVHSDSNAGNAGFAVEIVEVEEERPRGEAWEGVLAIEGHPTSDRRYLIPGEIEHRDLPLPIAPSHGKQHEAETVGRIELIEHIPAAEFDKEWDELPEDLSENAVIIWGEGTFDGSEEAEDAIRALENGVGISLDLPAERTALIKADTLEEVDPRDLEDDQLMGLMLGIIPEGYLHGFGGKIGGASLASVAAFEETRIRIVQDHVLVASAVQLKRHTLTASAAGLAPLKPPKEWFFTEEPNEPTPLTITDEGQVFGHLALWDQCHPAFASCERPPRSASEYAYFHVGELVCEEGDAINVGRITVGKGGRASGGHASIVLGRQGAMEHYEDTGCVGAFVRARDGNHGIWLSGAVRSDAPAERIRDLRANPPSGDWRDYELVGVLTVPVPGYPIPRARLVASAGSDEEEHVEALILTDYTEPIGDQIMDGDEVVGMTVTGWTFPCDGEEMSEAVYKRRKRMLTKRAKRALYEA